MSRPQRSQAPLAPRIGLRRKDLAQWFNAVDCHIRRLLEEDRLEKVSAGVYVAPRQTRRGCDGQAFIGNAAYLAHKDARFPAEDNKVIVENPAFDFSDQTTRDRFARAYAATSALYDRGQPSLDDILGRIQKYADRL